MHSSEERIPFTRAAYQQMQARFAQLQVLREEVTGRLKIAREMGDLSENGAYQYAKFELGNIGREMRRLRHLLKHGVITEKKSTGVVDFGSTVTLQSDRGQLEFMLVSEHESDPVKGKLSLQSPIGQAVVGKKAGETLLVVTPQGSVQYVVKSVH